MQTTETQLAPPTFGIALRRHRQAAGLTQEELAARSGLSVRAIRDMEQGRSARPYARSVEMLADALGLAGAQRSLLCDLARGAGMFVGAGLAGPCLLPAVVCEFVGRERELRALDGFLCRASEQGAGGTVVISAIEGTAGIGKTALAVHWASRVSGRFPDGQLHVNLRGFGPSHAPLTAAEAVAGFLAALGVAPEAMPPSLDARVGLYRSLIAGRRLLIVLDNARDAEQVRPLLPGSPGCLVLVTSRATLGGLVVSEAAHQLTLDVLSVDESRRLLTSRLGPRRAEAEPGALAELIGLTARLPLALAIVSARAAARPAFPLAGLAAELRGESGRLDALDAGDPGGSVRAVFSWSYDQLSPAGQRLFRLLGLHPGPEFTVHAAASLASTIPATARRLLDELARAHLLTEPAPGRFGCHDLLRAYAVGRAATTSSRAGRRAALGRLLDYYLHTAAAADRLLYPLRRRIAIAAPGQVVTLDDLVSHRQALAWFEAEHHAIAAMVSLAADNGFDVHAWQIAFSLETFFCRRGHWHDWAATQRTALDAACRLGDRNAQALAHCGIANAQIQAGQPAEALSHLATALRLREDTGDAPAQARVHLYASLALQHHGHYREALARSGRAVRLARTTGMSALLADAHNHVGWNLAKLGRYQQALGYCQQALAIDEQLGHRHNLPAALDSLAYIHRQLGHHAEAADCYRRAVELFDELGDRYEKAKTLANVGDAHHAHGDHAAARQAWTQALTIMDDLRHPLADTIRAKITH